jgi:hypothetical protein
MAQNRCYRLGQYEIIEDRNEILWWRSHAGMADTKGGRCLIDGNILVLGPPEIQQPGSLRREFMEHLKKLPRWDKTGYYCSSHSLYDSRTGERIRFGAGIAQYRPESHETSVSDATEDMRRGETINRRQGYLKEISSRMDVILEKAEILIRRWSGRNKK